MKRFSLKAALWATLSCVLLAGPAAVAQVPSAGPATGVNAAFVRLFGPASAFTAKVETRVQDRSGHLLVRMPMEYAALDGKVRLDIDLSQVQSKDFTAATLANIKQAGMDRVVSIFRPDKKLKYIIYPGIQSYQELALSRADTEASEQGLKLDQSAQGKDTLDGHPCVKHKVSVKGSKGSLLDALTWNATDLKDFPLQVEMKQKDGTVRMHFTGVQFAKPDPAQFEVPARYSRLK